MLRLMHYLEFTFVNSFSCLNMCKHKKMHMHVTVSDKNLNIVMCGTGVKDLFTLFVNSSEHTRTISARTISKSFDITISHDGVSFFYHTGSHILYVLIVWNAGNTLARNRFEVYGTHLYFSQVNFLDTLLESYCPIW